MKYLILGANGYIGGYLYRRMKQEGLEVIGSGHRSGKEKGLVYFDVLENSVSDITKCMTGKEKAAILCIAQTNIDRCKTEYELSRQINVTGIKKVIETLIQEKYYVIYFSTDNVFDGEKGNYTESDMTNAVNQYGKMKEEMEAFITDTYPEVCIFRLPKVLGVEREAKNMLTDWENKLDDDEIRCIRDMEMSVVAKEDIYQACLIAVGRKLKGIYNLCSGEIYSRKELAIKFFELLGADNKNIVELDVEEFGFRDKRPLNIGLNHTKFREKTGYQFTPYVKIVEEYFQHNRFSGKKQVK